MMPQEHRVKPRRIAFEDALQCIRANIGAGPCEVVPTTMANRRILAQPVLAQRDCPPFDMSAMDGYAIPEGMIAGPKERSLSIGKPQFAGEPTRPLAPNEARPIYTGAAVPSATGAILIQEYAAIAGPNLILSETLAPGSNIRRAGEDARAGETVLDATIKLNPATIGTLCAYGVAQVTVRARPRIVMLVLGDELADPQNVTADQIIDTNGPMVAAMLEDAGCTIIQRLRVNDDEQAIRTALDTVIDEGTADMILSTGGASAGAKDLLRPAIEAIGAAIHFHGVHMRPGKPVLFATAPGGIPIFGLPGNPVAALVGARFFVMAAIRAWYAMPPEPATTQWPDTVETGPTRVLKAHTRQGHSARDVCVLPGQQSHMMRPLLQANTWLITGAEQATRLFPLFDTLDL